MRKEILRAENICKSINGSKILDRLSLAVYEREILGLTGLSGTGKSVIAEILSGIRTYDKGELYVSGERLGMINIEKASERGIYHISVNPALFPCLSIEENFCLPEQDLKAAVCFPARRQLIKIREAFKALDIEVDTKAEVKSLSLYEKHRIAILRAFYLHAKLIIIDNITNEYTEEEFWRLGKLLLKLKTRGVSILFIESMLDRVTAFTDRLIVLRGGKDEGILFRDEYDSFNIEQIMMGDYSVPQTLEKTVSDYEKQILLKAENIWSKGIRGMSFHLKKGEVIGFIDEEKDMCEDVWRLFLGNADLSEGRVILEENQVPLRAGREAMIKAGFGYVDYYKNSIFPKLSLRDNLTITSLERLASRTVINSRLEKMVVQDLLRRLEVPLSDMKRPLKDVSNTEQLIAALYKWILNRSRVVIINNVLSGTDMIMHNIVVRFLNELREKGFGAILFSPNVREIFELCDRVYMVREGSITEVVTL